MAEKEYKIIRDIKFRENIVAAVPFLQDIRENETCDVDDVASKNNVPEELPGNKNIVLFKRRIHLNENVIGEVPVISPKRVLPTLTIPENINDITQEPDVKSPEIEFDEIYEFISKTPVNLESDIKENDDKEIEKIDPAVVEVKFEEILQSYENIQRHISQDAYNGSKPTKIPIFRQFSETGTRILSRAPRRRSLDNKEFKDNVQSKINTFESVEKTDNQIDNENKDSIIHYEYAKVVNDDDESLHTVEKKEELIEEQPDLTEKASHRRPVLAKFLNILRKNKKDKNISNLENTIEIQDVSDVRKKGKSGIPLLIKSSVPENTNHIDTENELITFPVHHTSQSDTNVYEDNTQLIEDKDIIITTETNIAKADSNNKINKVVTKPTIVQEQVKSSQTEYVSNLTDNAFDDKVFGNSLKETKSQTEHEKNMEKKKFKEQKGFEPVSSKIALFEDRKKLAPKAKLKKILKTKSNLDHNEEICDYTDATAQASSKPNNDVDINDFQHNVENNNIKKDDKDDVIIVQNMSKHKHPDLAKSEDIVVANINETHNVNVNFNGTKQESTLQHLNHDKLSAILAPIQQKLNNSKETHEKILTKPIKDIIKTHKDAIKSERDIVTTDDDIFKSDQDINKSNKDINKLDQDINVSEKDIIKADKDTIKTVEDIIHADKDVIQPHKNVIKTDKILIKEKKDIIKTVKDIIKSDSKIVKAERDIIKADNDVNRSDKNITKPVIAITKPVKNFIKADEDIIQADKDINKFNKDMLKSDVKIIKSEKDKTKEKKDIIKTVKDIIKSEKAIKLDNDVNRPDKNIIKPDIEITKPDKDIIKADEDIIKADKGINILNKDMIKSDVKIIKSGKDKIKSNKDINKVDIDIIKAEKDIYRPDKNIIKPDNKTTKPDIDVIKTHTDVITTDKNIMKQDSKITKPDKAIIKAQKDIFTIDKNIIKSEKDIKSSEKDINESDKDIIKPGKNITKADREIINSDDDIIKSDRNIKKPEKHIIKSDKVIIKRPLAIFISKSTIEDTPTLKRAKSIADIELGSKIKGKVELTIKELSIDRIFEKPVGIKMKERPRRNSVSEKIALFEKKITPVPMDNQPLTMEDRLKKAQETSLLGFEDELDSGRTQLSNMTEEQKKQHMIRRLINIKEELMPDKYDIMPFYRMRDGYKMPVIALGSALLMSDLTKYVVAAAIDLGYRAIDTAYIYGNEKEVGEGIQMKIDDGTIKREDIFVISKLWNTYHAPQLVETACKESLQALGLKYVDLYLIHQPMSFKEGPDPTPMVENKIQYSEQHDYVDAWKAMMELKRRKLVRSIGVSNFNIEQLQTLINETGETPAVNQIECHPYLTQRALSQFCKENHIAVSAYGVLGSKGTPAEYKSSNASAVLDDLTVKQLAKRSGLSPTQILLRYQLERGHCLVVKSTIPEHLLMNLSCLNMKLSKQQVAVLDQLNRDQRNFDFRGMGDTHKNYPFNAFE